MNCLKASVQSTVSGICASITLKAWLLQVLPEKTVAVLLYLAPHHKASRSARSAPSVLKLDFTVAESAAADGPVEQISDNQSAPAFTLPSPPPMPAQVYSWLPDTMRKILAVLPQI